MKRMGKNVICASTFPCLFPTSSFPSVISRPRTHVQTLSTDGLKFIPDTSRISIWRPFGLWAFPWKARIFISVGRKHVPLLFVRWVFRPLRFHFSMKNSDAMIALAMKFARPRLSVHLRVFLSRFAQTTFIENHNWNSLNNYISQRVKIELTESFVSICDLLSDTIFDIQWLIIIINDSYVYYEHVLWYYV